MSIQGITREQYVSYNYGFVTSTKLGLEILEYKITGGFALELRKDDLSEYLIYHKRWGRGGQERTCATERLLGAKPFGSIT